MAKNPWAVKISEESVHISIAQYFFWALPEDVIWTTHENSVQFGFIKNPRPPFNKPVFAPLWRYIGAIFAKLQKTMAAKGVRKGWPDMELVYKCKLTGRPITILIEIKSPTGSLSIEQRALHKQLIAVGYYVELARSIADVEAIIRKYNVPCKAHVQLL